MKLTDNKGNDGKEAAARILIAAAIFTGALITAVALGQRVIQERSEAILRDLAKKPAGYHKVSEDESVSSDSVSSDEASREDKEIPIDFETLQQVNPDIRAWITIPYTSVDYPVLCATDEEGEDYYLRRDYKGKENNHGSIYIQTGDAYDFSSRVTILYGHNMRDGSMFGTLHGLLMRPAAFSQSLIIYQPNRMLEGQLIACYETDDEYIPEKFGYFRSARFVLDYINSFENTTDLFTTISNDIVNGKYDIVTLSTCTKAGEKRVLAQYAIPSDQKK